MTRFCLAAVVAVALFVSASGALAMQAAPTPPEILIYKTPLMVTGEVTESAAAEKVSIQLADMTQAREYWLVKHKIKIAKVIKDSYATTQPANDDKVYPKIKPLAEGDVIDVFEMSNDPAVDVKRAFPPMAKGQSYVLLLEKPKDNATYYVQCFLPGDQAKAFERVADVDKWAWGKTVDGLQLALCLPPTAIANRNIGAVIAVRNTTDKPIVLNLDPADKFLSGTITGDQAGAIDFYKLMRVDVGTFEARYTTTIQPKAVAFIGPTGQTPYTVFLPVDLKPGKATLQITYTSTREGEGDPKLWKGTLQSATVEIEIKVGDIGPPVAPKVPPINEAVGG